MQETEKMVNSLFYGYINGDILLSESVFVFLQTIYTNQNGHSLLNPGCLFAGRVSEVSDISEFNLSPAKASEFFDAYYHKGSLRNRFSSDYFIYPGHLYSSTPELFEDVVLGRYYIDNWIMGSVLVKNGVLVDATKTSRTRSNAYLHIVHGIHMGADTYWKRSIRTMISLKDFYYNKEIVRADYPWTSLVYSNYTTGNNLMYISCCRMEKVIFSFR